MDREFKSHPGGFGSTPVSKLDIISFGLWMRRQGCRHSTVNYCIQALKSIARHANLLHPEFESGGVWVFVFRVVWLLVSYDRLGVGGQRLGV
jgi:hypothetical protein